MIAQYFTNIISLINEIAPFLILGFLISGILSIFLTVDFISKYLGENSYKSVVLASLLGIPIPLCSCGVIPVTAYLRKHGASKASSASFLISTPQTGIDSIIVTYSMLGPFFAIYRPIIAFISGVLGGGIIKATDKNGNDVENIECEDECCNEYASESKIVRILHYGLIRLPQDIISPLVIGILLSGLISIMVPENFFSDYGTGIIGMLIMLIISLPAYICATASIPLAFVFYTKGFSLGAILVFLMAGPATNITTIAVSLKILGKRSTLIYLGSIIMCALIGGAILDFIAPKMNVFATDYHVHIEKGIITYASSILLLGIIINSFRLQYFSKQVLNSNVDINSYSSTFIEGMTCSHCEESVKKSLLKINGIDDVIVNLKTGEVKISGENNQSLEIHSIIQQLGYKIKSWIKFYL